MHPAQRQHDTFRLSLKRLNRAGDIDNMGPAVLTRGTPSGSCQRKQRQIERRAGMIGIPAHTCRERMRGIHHMGDAFGAQKACQPLNTAKTTHALRDRLVFGLGDAASIAKDGLDPRFGHRLRQCAGLSGAAQNKEMW